MLAGALLLVFAFGLYGAVGDRWSGRVGAALLALFAAVELAVGAYLHLDCSLADAACRSAEHTTRHELHEALSGVSFLALLVAIFSLARRFHLATAWQGVTRRGCRDGCVPRSLHGACAGAGRRHRPAPRDNDSLRLDRRNGLSSGLATSRSRVPSAFDLSGRSKCSERFRGSPVDQCAQADASTYGLDQGQSSATSPRALYAGRSGRRSPRPASRSPSRPRS